VTGAEALSELLDRIGASRDGAVFISDHELSRWPGAAVAAFKSAGLLAAASPASSVVCPGCERQCTMPVDIAPAGAFVVCDKRSDINRVPIGTNSLVRWQASGEAVAALLARLLRLTRRMVAPTQQRRSEVGVFKGRKGSSHLVLTADGELKLRLAGHTLPLVEVLSLKGKSVVVDEKELTERVDNPASGGGDVESANQKAARLQKRRDQLKAEGQRYFLRQIAREERISVSRIKQILARRKT
jgi:hypothetical protein